jgi:hypothetical protein
MPPESRLDFGAWLRSQLPRTDNVGHMARFALSLLRTQQWCGSNIDTLRLTLVTRKMWYQWGSAYMVLAQAYEDYKLFGTGAVCYEYKLLDVDAGDNEPYCVSSSVPLNSVVINNCRYQIMMPRVVDRGIVKEVTAYMQFADYVA